MKIEYTPKALKDLEFWRQSGNKQIQKKIFDLTEEMKLTPFEGTGKPEALKHSLTGLWSRRITNEHRLIYEVGENVIPT